MLVDGAKYIIRTAKAPNFVVDLTASQADGDLIAFTFHNGNNQIWKAEKVEGDIFRLQSLATGTYVVAPVNGASGQALKCARLDSSNTKLSEWRLLKLDSAQYEITSVYFPSKGFDLTSDDVKDRVPIDLQDFDGQTKKKWTIEEVDV